LLSTLNFDPAIIDNFASGNTCTDCHVGPNPSGADHIDGVKEDSLTVTYSFAANITAYSQAAGCQANCHSDGADWGRKWIGVTDAQPAYTDDPATAAVCGNCHGSFNTGWNWNETTTGTDHTDPDGDNVGDGMGNHANCTTCHGWGDAVGEPVGTRFGRHPYRVPSLAGVPATRTLEGSLAGNARPGLRGLRRHH